MSGRRFLVVEDEPMIAMLLEDFLDVLGHRLGGVAENLEEARALAGAGEYDAAILDVNIQGEKIWPVAEILAEKGVPLIIATGGSEPFPDGFGNAIELLKPYNLASLEAALAQLP